MRTIRVSLYCDEIKEVPFVSFDGTVEYWVYLGMLIVPEHRKAELLKALFNKRCGNPDHKQWALCRPKCVFHDKNDKEVHYSSLRGADEAHIAKRWIEFFLNDKAITHFYFFGINVSRLNRDFFGDAKGTERYYTIYNRFFRTAVQKSVKSYFSSYDKIMIADIWHDAGELEGHERFPWHTIQKLEDDPKLIFENNSIRFLDSDHRKSMTQESHLIQYADLILGLMYNCIHATSTTAKPKELTMHMLPLVSRLMDAPGNINCTFQYVGRISLDFFPKHVITTEDSLENQFKALDSFYKKRPLRIQESDQKELFV